jgi:hypothetical protein
VTVGCGQGGDFTVFQVNIVGSKILQQCGQSAANNTNIIRALTGKAIPSLYFAYRCEDDH